MKPLLVLMRLNASSQEKVLHHVGSARGDTVGDGGANLLGHCRGRTQGTKTDSSNLLLALSIRSSAWLQRRQASISGSSRRLPTRLIHSLRANVPLGLEGCSPEECLARPRAAATHSWPVKSEGRGFYCQD